MVNYVAYYRVSTAKQGRSGLGLAAQHEAVCRFLRADDQLVAEYTEVETGGNDERDEVWAALRHAKRDKAKLIIARLDRFSRRVSFIAKIMEEGVKLVVAEMPHASDFQLHIFAALAQEERRLISERTKSALREAKRRGQVLGLNGRVLAVKNREAADAFASELWAYCAANGIYGSYANVANRLNQMGRVTRNGGNFYPQTIKNYTKRLPNFPRPLC